MLKRQKNIRFFQINFEGRLVNILEINTLQYIYIKKKTIASWRLWLSNSLSILRTLGKNIAGLFKKFAIVFQ